MKIIKKVVMYLGSLLVAAWIVSNFILGGIENNNSLQGQANDIMEKSNQVISELINNY